MELKDRIKIAITVASLAAISIFFTTQYRRRRKQKCLPGSCYLLTEQKPQHSFKRVLTDNSYSPFKHANIEKCTGSHPNEVEIKALIENPQPDFDVLENGVNLRMGDSYIWVETKWQLEELADTLRSEKVFAVDTEQHSLRSFLGFTALIQISTAREDYLVDTIALHDEMNILRPVFADQNICKVFHGADNDVLWLQRDFHIYVVNMFDTAKACEVLSKPQKSLAYLLETYCGVTTNKLFQREDWRQRPLSEEMVHYARTDAHYLLYIGSCLIAELKRVHESSTCPDDKFNVVLEASRRSNLVCLQLYTKEIEDYPGDSAASSIIFQLLNGQGGTSSNSSETQELVRRLCAWRNLMARVHDESLRFVLSDQAIVALADKAPATQTDISSTINEADLEADSLNFISAFPSPSPVVCSHLHDICHLMQDKLGNRDDIFQAILQKCLGQNGSCPLSVFNYSLLGKCNLNLKNQSNRLIYKRNGDKNSRQVARKASRQLFVEKFSCKAPVYHNCRIYANDGRLLCYCDRRKLEWYIRRDLAKLVDDDPPAIMLLFEPKGRPEDEGNDFYIQSKKNICVGCGEGNHYLRYRIIPSCYRMHFPEHLKSHRSHDIVLLCVDCHEVAHATAEKYKKEIAAEFGIPLFIHTVIDAQQEERAVSSSSAMDSEETGVSPLQLRTAAMALLRHGPRMPSNRREELTQVVIRYYGGREISEEDLERALLIGMSPRERRRLEKKRGLTLKHSTDVDLSDKEHKKHACGMVSSATNGAARVDNSDGLHAPGAETLGENGSTDPSQAEENCQENCYTNEVPSTKDEFDGNGEDDSGNRSRPDGNGYSRHHSKLSLLGHGPHGRRVVDYIMQEYEEDGIRQFCQRWRQVFVEALHPKFLPPGWDVMHSGRREFGEYSVYNPAKKSNTPSPADTSS